MERENSLLKKAPLVGGVVVVLILISAMVWFVRDFMANTKQKPARTVQNITVIRPPPPPPPPEEKPPPPPPDKLDEPLPQKEPEPSPDNAPTPSQQLGLDADGAAGDDGFGLAARRGGDLVVRQQVAGKKVQRRGAHLARDRRADQGCQIDHRQRQSRSG
jgi:protein TonB